MQENDIIVVGSGGHAKVVIDIFEKDKNYNIIGLLDSFKPVGTEVFGYQVIGDETLLLQKPHLYKRGVVAIGDNWDRSKMVKKILEMNTQFSFVTAIHPSCSIAKGVSVGEGSVLMAGCIINSDTKVGKHCIINTKAATDHDSQLGDFVALAPGSTTGGRVIIGDYSVVSVGASIIQGIKIGEHSLIGAGSVVVRNVESQSVYYGIPARLIRKRQIGEKYL